VLGKDVCLHDIQKREDSTIVSRFARKIMLMVVLKKWIKTNFLHFHGDAANFKILTKRWMDLIQVDAGGNLPIPLGPQQLPLSVF